MGELAIGQAGESIDGQVSQTVGGQENQVPCRARRGDPRVGGALVARVHRLFGVNGGQGL